MWQAPQAAKKLSSGLIPDTTNREAISLSVVNPADSRADIVHKPSPYKIIEPRGRPPITLIANADEFSIEAAVTSRKGRKTAFVAGVAIWAFPMCCSRFL